MKPQCITLADLKAARDRLAKVAFHTPLVPCPRPDPDRALYFKAENLQPIGAFKLRGAYHKMAQLSPAERKKGVIAFSSGNHAQGVAYAAREMGMKAVIVMPGIASQVKIEKTRALGAEVVLLEEGGIQEWRAEADRLAKTHGYTVIPPFDDPAVIAGQGTIGLEILQDLPDADTVLVQVGGGGLISGIAAAIKLSGSRAKVIGVEPALANDAHTSFYSGRICALPFAQTCQTMADGLRSTSVSELTFAHIQAFVDDIVTVTEEQIAEAVRRMVFNVGLVPEPSGAVGFAGYLFCRDKLPPGQKSVAVISGGNVEPSVLVRILQEPGEEQSP